MDMLLLCGKIGDKIWGELGDKMPFLFNRFIKKILIKFAIQDWSLKFLLLK